MDHCNYFMQLFFIALKKISSSAVATHAAALTPQALFKRFNGSLIRVLLVCSPPKKAP
jgi:hypothetical protein